MTLPNLFTGQLVRLAAQNLDTDAALFARWSTDSTYLRLLDSDPARPSLPSRYQRLAEERAEREYNFPFAVRALDGDRLIGFISLWIWSWPDANGGLGIGLGDPEYRGRGYGTDAMRVALRYAFSELGLERVTIQAVAHNTRAIRSYEKAGYVLAGTEREMDWRDGRRSGVVTLTITRAAWTNTLGDTLLPYIDATRGAGQPAGAAPENPP